MEAFPDKQTLMSSKKQLEPTFSFGESALSTAESFCLTTDASYQDDSDIVAPHASQRSVMPGEQAFRDASFVITQDPRAISQVVGTDPRGHVPSNVAVAVESATFVGRMCNAIKGHPGTPAAEFRGTKLLGRSIIQGMFKEPTAAKNLWVGQELLNKPLLPTSFQRLVFTTAAKLFSSTYRVMVEGDGEAVGYMNPLLAMAARVNVSLPGQQPDLRAATEDMRLLDSSLTDKSGQPLSSAQRQRFFDKPSNLEGAVFSTEYVYTFVIEQSIVDMESYRLKLGAFINLDLCPVLNGQPLQMMCKNIQSNELVVGLLVWHKHLNYPPGGRKRRDSDTDSSCQNYSLASPSSLASASSLCTSSSGVLSSMYSSSTLCSNSSLSSECSLSDNSGDSCADGAASECDQEECGSDAGGDRDCCSDYYSCVDESEQLGQHGLQQEELFDGVTGSSGGSSDSLLSDLPSAAAAADTTKQSPLLEMAFSAPADLRYLAHEAYGSSSSTSHTSVQVTVSPEDAQDAGVTAAAAAAAAQRVGGKQPLTRKSSGGKAMAAVASAAQRMVTRFKARNHSALRRRNKLCPGDAL